MFLFLWDGLVLPPIQCYKPPSIVLQVLCLLGQIAWTDSSPPLHNHKGFDLGHMNGLVVFPTFFSLGLLMLLLLSCISHVQLYVTPQIAVHQAPLSLGFFRPGFCNKDLIITFITYWATVSSRSYFCWLYRESPSLTADNIICLISIFNIQWCSFSRVVSCIVGRRCLLWPVGSLIKIVSLCTASFCTSRPSLPVTPGISWLPTFAFQSPIMKTTSFLVLVLEDLTGLHRTVQLQLLQH